MGYLGTLLKAVIATEDGMQTIDRPVPATARPSDATCFLRFAAIVRRICDFLAPILAALLYRLIRGD